MTTTWTSPVVVEGGTRKLICPGETKNSGAAVPLTVTVVPKSVVGSGCAVATCVPVASSVPNAATIESGASGAGAPTKLAAETLVTGTLF